MKRLITIIVSLITMIGCQKEDNGPVSPTLVLIRHDWTVISSRIFFPDGSNYLLLNDEENFRDDGKLIKMYKGFSGLPFYDTSVYRLLENNTSLLFYAYKNGVQDSTPDTATIKTLTNNLFVYYFTDFSTGTISFLDSLKR